MTEKLKSFLQNDRHFFGLLLILSAVISFYLGRFSVDSLSREGEKDNILISKALMVDAQHKIPSSTVAASPNRSVEDELFVASKSGTKYHRQDCPGASQIKPENRIEFTSAAAAASAGYTPAANCPGL